MIKIKIIFLTNQSGLGWHWHLAEEPENRKWSSPIAVLTKGPRWTDLIVRKIYSLVEWETWQSSPCGFSYICWGLKTNPPQSDNPWDLWDFWLRGLGIWENGKALVYGLGVVTEITEEFFCQFLLDVRLSRSQYHVESHCVWGSLLAQLPIHVVTALLWSASAGQPNGRSFYTYYWVQHGSLTAILPSTAPNEISENLQNLLLSVVQVFHGLIDRSKFLRHECNFSLYFESW